MKIALNKKVRLLVKIPLYVIYCLLACEFFLRIFSPAALLPLGFRATPYGLRGNEMNRRYRHVSPDYRITVRTNSKGIRADREIPYEKGDGIKRVVLLGDSFAMGCGVNIEETFSSQLERCLKENSVNAEVVNLGTPSFGNAEELILLKEEGLKYHPDLVLLAWHPSDYAENVRSNLFGLENGSLVRRNDTYMPSSKFAMYLSQFKMYRWLTENSHLYKFTRKFAYVHVRRPLGNLAGGLSSALKAKSRNVGSNAEIQQAKDKPSSPYRRQLTAALLNEIKKECEAHGANFLILDVPLMLSRTEFESKFFTSQEDITTRLEVFNPIKLFEQEKGKKLYWENSEGHFTPLGCRIVGEGLARLIISKDLLNTNEGVSKL